MSDRDYISDTMGPFGVIPYWLFDAKIPVRDDKGDEVHEDDGSLRTRAISHGAVRAWLVLWRYADRKTMSCWPSRKRIATDMGLQRAHSIDPYLDELVEAGALVIEPMFVEGRQVSNRYRLFTQPPDCRDPAASEGNKNQCAGIPDPVHPLYTNRATGVHESVPSPIHESVHKPEPVETRTREQDPSIQIPRTRGRGDDDFIEKQPTLELENSTDFKRVLEVYFTLLGYLDGQRQRLLDEAITEYGADLVEAAIREAAIRGAKHWNYVSRVLATARETGKWPGGSKKKLREKPVFNWRDFSHVKGVQEENRRNIESGFFD